MNTRRDPVFGCELFAGRLDGEGYGRMGSRKAHVVAWEAAFGPVPEGFVLDHLCRRRNCCAPHHLEAVTQSENLRRREWRVRARRVACPKGHDLQTTAQVTPEGGRVCRQCNQEARAAPFDASP